MDERSRPTSDSADRLACVALRLVEQARVLQRQRQRRRHGGEQAHVGVAEGVVALVVLDHHVAEQALAGQHRRAEQRARAIGAFRHRHALAAICSSTEPNTKGRGSVTHRWMKLPGTGLRGGLAGSRTPCSTAYDVQSTPVRPRPRRGCRGRRCRTPRAACRRPGRRWPGSRAAPAMPCWMLLITASSAFALLGLLQQPLRLVEQARVLQRDAHAGGDGREQRAPRPRRRRSRARGSRCTMMPSTRRAPPRIGHDDDRQAPVGARHGGP